MRRLSRFSSLAALLLAGLFAGACDRPAPTVVDDFGDPIFKSDEGRGQGQFVNAMTRNLYVGTDVALILGAAPETLPVAVMAAHMDVVRSDPAARMAAIADEIAERRPDLVGLQEVSQLFTQTPGDFLIGNPQVASDLQFDFLTLLLEALEARGTPYIAVASVENVDIEMPAWDPATQTFYDVRLVDRDVILARRGVQTSNPQSANFEYALPVSIGAVSFVVPRGWTSVDARVHGRQLRFVNTHLETQAAPPLNALQGAELLEIVGRSPLPVVLVGDFNSPPTPFDPASPPGMTDPNATYWNIVAAGYRDAWISAGRGGEDGFTCCLNADLKGGAFDERVDLVFFSDAFRAADRAEIFGVEPTFPAPHADWPSDHAGVTAWVRLP
jgi:endonuclease/exonuclease/phosphatase family metal-dependent hydrolase